MAFAKGNSLRKGKTPWNKGMKGNEYLDHFEDPDCFGKQFKDKKPHNFINHYNFASKQQRKIYKECVLCKGPNDVMHHRDHDQDNNAKYNTIVLCHPCHTFWHQNWLKRTTTG